MALLRQAWHPLAEEEAVQARDWYAERSPKAARRFTDSLEKSVNLVCSNPTLFAIRDHGLRIAILPIFPYSVLYRETLGVVQIIALAHAKRRPGYWRTRLSS